MGKFFLLVTLLGLLIVARGVSGSMTCDNNIGMVEELNNLDIEEENEVEFSDIPSWTSERGGKVLVNVDSFGAAGDGETDDTSVSSFILVPFSMFNMNFIHLRLFNICNCFFLY